ncbi:hypothetical protein FEM48_Zijuj09G0081500 [Ziziphus jujuba var. spinosa]|uniref:Uncharacterized protein n=1 Tax=Ziziphus jujuba var. spinosa TaxID=714518 RepID=A0A978URU4_ZIZJJ|nr:hypothetical protein FEM48_Zijuj09G0081500 [Ziziphus jujuba var. spinosa]
MADDHSSVYGHKTKNVIKHPQCHKHIFQTSTCLPSFKQLEAYLLFFFTKYGFVSEATMTRAKRTNCLNQRLVAINRSSSPTRNVNNGRPP